MENQLVSILIPVYNRLSLVSETIESAINQTYKNIEIIICDNCSTDGTWELIQQYALKDNRIIIFQNNSNIGPVNNWFKCLSFATGQYIKLLWSDDLIEKSYISKAIKLFDDDTSIVMSGIIVFSESKYKYFSRYQKLNEISSKSYLLDMLIYNRHNFPGSPGCAVLRNSHFISKIPTNLTNNFNLDFSKNGAGIDLLFFLFSALEGRKIKFINENLSYFRSHKESITVIESSSIIIYYELAKLYFINQFYPKYLDEFKTALRIKLIFNKAFKNIDQQVNGKYVININLILLFIRQLTAYTIQKMKYIIKILINENSISSTRSR